MDVELPAWLRELTPDVLARHFDAPTLQRAKTYASQGRVGRIKSLGQHGLQAEVRGNRPTPYTVLITGRPALNQPALAANPGIPRPAMLPAAKSGTRPGVQNLRLQCSCPMAYDCKHALATLLVANQQVVLGRGSRRNWRFELGALLDIDPSGRPETGERLAIETSLVGRDVELRPLKMGARGKWIRANLTWDTAGFTHGVRREHAKAMRAIGEHADRARAQRAYGYGYHDRNSLRLAELGHEVWPLLARARAAGIEFVARDASDRLTIGGPELDLSVEITRDDDGLTLRPALTGTPEGHKVETLLGMPAHGALLRGPQGQVVALGFTHALSNEQHQLATLRTPITIPDDELEPFTFGYLPRLREHVPVVAAPDIDLPSAPRPVALVTAITSPRSQPGPAQASITLGYRYGSTTDVTPFQGREHPLRDRPSEQALRPVFEKALAGTPLAVEAELHPAELPAEVMLSGASALRTIAHLQSLEGTDELVVEVTGELAEATELGEAEVSLDMSRPEGRDWFDLAIEMTVDGAKVPLAELIVALAQGLDHLVLDGGRWVSLDNPEIIKLRNLLEESDLIPEVVPDADGALHVRLRPEHVSWFDELAELGVLTRESDEWSRIANRLHGNTPHEAIEAPTSLDAQLRGYQLTGLRWLDFLAEVGIGGILADDMGLGKTLQAIALVASLHERGLLHDPVLVVAPSSVVGGWVEQLARFAPRLGVVALTETSRKRGTNLDEAIATADVVVTSYAIARLDVDQFAARHWQVVFLDEAQFVKNPASSTYQAMRRIPCGVRFCLSGTPLENNLMDLWSLLSLCAPGLFRDPKSFRQNYAKPIENRDEDAAERLQRLLRRTRPVMLRRTKELVAPELPPRQEQVLTVPLAPAHRKTYERHLAQERKKVLGLVGDLQKNRIEILSALTRLRQLSLAAQLVDDKAEGLPSAKIDTLVEMLGDVIAGGHRALVFSSFTSYLGMVRDRLKGEGIATVYLDGRTRKRQERIDEFRSGGAPVFLISLKAGGFGLNLTEADYVFVLDPWWNPAAEAQAIDRAHRIGQTRQVMVYRMISEDTIEQKVLALQASKRELFDQVVDGGDATAAGALSADDIRALFA